MPERTCSRRAAERQQHVAGGEHHLERDEQVEQVAGDERRRNAGGEDHVHRLEADVVALGAGLADRVDQHGEQHQRPDRSMIADSRSTTSVMPIGAGQSPACITTGPSRSTSTSSTHEITLVADSTDTPIDPLRQLHRPARLDSAAPSIGSSTGGEEKVVIARPRRSVSGDRGSASSSTSVVGDSRRVRDRAVARRRLRPRRRR